LIIVNVNRRSGKNTGLADISNLLIIIGNEFTEVTAKDKVLAETNAENY